MARAAVATSALQVAAMVVQEVACEVVAAMAVASSEVVPVAASMAEDAWRAAARQEAMGDDRAVSMGVVRVAVWAARVEERHRLEAAGMAAATAAAGSMEAAALAGAKGEAEPRRSEL